ncbi:hypothetical protein EVAR_36583_1 [Eumeta japonica]|uniref:Uncharacterized protein n=1 Tax=Eumeta variegata TaxID=151549 RepID=A0A4C1XPJ1_EUMVA|nr:hypothetical protein EVAR_36583_1 [Eumeta japonica]
MVESAFETVKMGLKEQLKRRKNESKKWWPLWAGPINAGGAARAPTADHRRRSVCVSGVKCNLSKLGPFVCRTQLRRRRYILGTRSMNIQTFLECRALAGGRFLFAGRIVFIPWCRGVGSD